MTESPARRLVARARRAAVRARTAGFAPAPDVDTGLPAADERPAERVSTEPPREAPPGGGSRTTGRLREAHAASDRGDAEASPAGPQPSAAEPRPAVPPEEAREPEEPKARAVASTHARQLAPRVATAPPPAPRSASRPLESVRKAVAPPPVTSPVPGAAPEPEPSPLEVVPGSPVLSELLVPVVRSEPEALAAQGGEQATQATHAEARATTAHPASGPPQAAQEVEAVQAVQAVQAPVGARAPAAVALASRTTAASAPGRPAEPAAPVPTAPPVPEPLRVVIDEIHVVTPPAPPRDPDPFASLAGARSGASLHERTR